MLKDHLYVIILVFILVEACHDKGNADQEEPVPNDTTGQDTPGSSDLTVVSFFPEDSFQRMIGFGGSLSWHCDRITRSPKRDEIVDLIVNDLGLDMLRLKNWYYPADYPEDKAPDKMEISWFLYHFHATNELHDLVKTLNPDIRIFFSSWGPPSALKSNGRLDHGTLARDSAGEFVYEQFADYWLDVMQHLTFVPDYVSIQNEPTWVAEWETCEWRIHETENFPSYARAFDLVAQRFEESGYRCMLTAPESANLSPQAFDHFAIELADNPRLSAYSYHPYNFSGNSPLSTIQADLAYLGTTFTDRPIIMSEYSGLSWMKTAQFIHSTLREANTAAYLYWTLMWAPDAADAMIKVQDDGDFVLTAYYYLMKHYAKFVSAGDFRIRLDSDARNLDQVAFVNSEQERITWITVNSGDEEVEVEPVIGGIGAEILEAYQSTEFQFFRSLVPVNGRLKLGPRSVTTVSLTPNR